MALVGFVILLGAAGVRIWAMLTLLHRYRPAEYLSDERARVLYVANIVMTVVMVGAIVFLALHTRISWVEIAGIVLSFAFTAKLVWAVWMRFSGRSKVFYAARQWK